MSGFAVDLERLTDLIERMVACAGQLQQVQDDVDARARRLQVSWQGAAATEHTQAHQRWVAGSQQMRDALATLRAVASGADANYTAAITANRQMWSV